MGLFDDIKARIFGAAPEAPEPAAPELNAAQQAAVAAGMAAANKVIDEAVARNAAASKIDVEAILDAAVAKSGQQLNWKISIVDLMKALSMDSSLSARKQLADELGYDGDKSDSATMNVWLHKQVLARLAENGGKVPPSMLA